MIDMCRAHVTITGGKKTRKSKPHWVNVYRSWYGHLWDDKSICEKVSNGDALYRIKITPKRIKE